MNLDHWKSILATHRDVLQLLDRQLQARGGGVSHQWKALPRMGREDMDVLHQQVLEEMIRLEKTLAVNLSSEVVDDIMRPLSYLFDEWVLRRLAEEDRPLWPLLQKRRFKEDSGGSHFYEFTDLRLKQPGTPTLVFEVLHFCLSAGFTGRYEDYPAKLSDYRKQLAARIPQPQPVPAPPPPPLVETPTVYEFPLRYYLTTGFVIVSLPVVLWLLSN